MKDYKHFSHPHNLSFHKSLEDAKLTCTGCKFSCTKTPVYSCGDCEFFLHDLCFNATRSLIHPSHTDHPLSLFPSPTYSLGSFICNSCNETGSGFCFCCPACEFDLHVHCAYKHLRPTSSLNPQPDQIKLKSHPIHPLHYLPKCLYKSGSYICNVCGTRGSDGECYHCDLCNYDAHVGCINLPETVKREDHDHKLSLLHVIPYTKFHCDVCKEVIQQRYCMYSCKAGCDYGVHVKCVARKA